MFKFRKKSEAAQPNAPLKGVGLDERAPAKPSLPAPSLKPSSTLQSTTQPKLPASSTSKVQPVAETQNSDNVLSEKGSGSIQKPAALPKLNSPAKPVSVQGNQVSGGVAGSASNTPLKAGPAKTALPKLTKPLSSAQGKLAGSVASAKPERNVSATSIPKPKSAPNLPSMQKPALQKQGVGSAGNNIQRIQKPKGAPPASDLSVNAKELKPVAVNEPAVGINTPNLKRAASANKSPALTSTPAQTKQPSGTALQASIEKLKQTAVPFQPPGKHKQAAVNTFSSKNEAKPTFVKPTLQPAQGKENGGGKPVLGASAEKQAEYVPSLNQAEALNQPAKLSSESSAAKKMPVSKLQASVEKPAASAEALRQAAPVAGAAVVPGAHAQSAKPSVKPLQASAEKIKVPGVALQQPSKGAQEAGKGFTPKKELNSTSLQPNIQPAKDSETVHRGLTSNTNTTEASIPVPANLRVPKARLEKSARTDVDATVKNTERVPSENINVPVARAQLHPRMQKPVSGEVREPLSVVRRPGPAVGKAAAANIAGGEQSTEALPVSELVAPDLYLPKARNGEDAVNAEDASGLVDADASNHLYKRFANKQAAQPSNERSQPASQETEDVDIADSRPIHLKQKISKKSGSIVKALQQVPLHLRHKKRVPAQVLDGALETARTQLNVQPAASKQVVAGTQRGIALRKAPEAAKAQLDAAQSASPQVILGAAANITGVVNPSAPRPMLAYGASEGSGAGVSLAEGIAALRAAGGDEIILPVKPLYVVDIEKNIEPAAANLPLPSAPLRSATRMQPSLACVRLPQGERSFV